MNDENPSNTQETKIIFGRDEIDNLFVKSVSEIDSTWNLIGGAEGPSLFYYMTNLKSLPKSSEARRKFESNNSSHQR